MHVDVFLLVIYSLVELSLSRARALSLSLSRYCPSVGERDVCRGGTGILFTEPNPTGSRPSDLIGLCRQHCLLRVEAWEAIDNTDLT